MNRRTLPSLAGLVLAGLVACGPRVDPVTGEYPLTGRTVTYDLEISEFDWEVAPGAVFQAIGFNKTVPGPILEAIAGDTIEIRLTNNTTSPRSIHTHVVRFAEDSDGAMRGVAQPGETITVRWQATFAGSFPYHDHAGHGGETEALGVGLYGPLVVHAPDARRAQQENVVVLADMDVRRYKGLPGQPVGQFPATEGDQRGHHQYMHTINGRAYEDWVPRFKARVGDLVRWRVISLGSEFHTFHVHGHRWVGPDGAVTDNINLGPATYATFEWVEDNPGEWLYHCHVPDHMEGGMMGIYEVSP